MSSSPRTDSRLAVALAVAATILLVGLGVALHPLPSVDGEADNYLGRAICMAADEPAGDSFHPYGVPLLISLGIRLGLDGFATARLLSAIGAGLTVAATYLLARNWTGRTAALLGAAAVAAADLVLVQGQLASSDMLATGLLALCLAAWVRAARSPYAALGATALGGLCLGLAIACRHPSAFFAGAALPLLGRPWRRSLRRGLVLGLALLPGLAIDPLCQLRFGDGIDRGGGLACVVLKYQLDFDFEAMNRLTRAQVLADLAQSWPDWLLRGLGDAASLFFGGLSRALASAAHGPLAFAFGLLLLLAVVAGLFRRDGTRILAAAAIGYGLLLALTYVPGDRFVLPLLPALVPLLLALASRLPRGAAASAALLLFAFAAAHAPAALARFAGRHPLREIDAARAIVAAERRPLVILADFWQLQGVDGCWVDSTLMNWRMPPDGDCWGRLQQLVARAGADYVLLDEHRSQPLASALAATPAPPGWLLHRHDGLLSVRCDPRAGTRPWPIDAERTARGHQLRFDPGPLRQGQQLVAAGFLACAPDGQWHIVAATPTPHGFAADIPAGIAACAGEWQFYPAMFVRPGGLQRGRPLCLDFAQR